MVKYWKIVIVVIVVLVVVIAAGIVSQTWLPGQRSSYSIVLMSNGDIYVGRLSYFPKLELREAYQVTKDQPTEQNKEPNFRLVPLKEALWAPDVLYLNPKQILLTAPVGENSRIMNALKGGVPAK